MRALLRMLLVAATFVLHSPAWAQAAATYPNRPVRMIVPFPAGGPTDVLARVVAQRMSEAWGQQVIVDNKPGGNTIIGAELAAKAPADGYTLLMAIDSTLVMNQFLYSRLPYDPRKDFVPISLLAWSPLVLVTDAATGPRSMGELIERARANPGKLSFGAGTVTTQLAGEMIKAAAGIDVMYVPYKGSAGTVQGLLSGDVTFILDGVTASVPHVRSGKFRALANLGSRPIAALPDLPTIASQGAPGVDVAVWLGLVAPAGIPADIQAKIHQEVARAVALPDVRERLLNAGLDPASSSPSEFGRFIASESDRWGALIKRTGIRLD